MDSIGSTVTPQGRNKWYRHQSQVHEPTIEISTEMERTLIVSVTELGFPVTEDIIHQVFNPYGYVDKVDILHVQEDFKALVRFHSSSDAKLAKLCLNGRYIYDCCNMLDIRHSYDYILEGLREMKGLLEDAQSRPNESTKSWSQIQESISKLRSPTVDLCHSQGELLPGVEASAIDENLEEELKGSMAEIVEPQVFNEILVNELEKFEAEGVKPQVFDEIPVKDFGKSTSNVINHQVFDKSQESKIRVYSLTINYEIPNTGGEEELITSGGNTPSLYSGDEVPHSMFDLGGVIGSELRTTTLRYSIIVVVTLLRNGAWCCLECNHFVFDKGKIISGLVEKDSTRMKEKGLAEACEGIEHSCLTLDSGKYEFLCKLKNEEKEIVEMKKIGSDATEANKKDVSIVAAREKSWYDGKQKLGQQIGGLMNNLSDVELYARLCGKLILEFLKRGGSKIEEEEVLKPNVDSDLSKFHFGISKGHRAFIEEDEAHTLLSPLKDPEIHCIRIWFSNWSFCLGAVEINCLSMEDNFQALEMDHEDSSSMLEVERSDGSVIIWEKKITSLDDIVKFLEFSLYIAALGILILADITTQLKNKNVTTYLKVDTSSNLVATITVDQPYPGLKTILNFKVPDQRSEKLELQYLHYYVGEVSSIGLTSNLVVNFSGVLGTNILALGCDVSYDTKSRVFTKCNFGASYSSSDLIAALTLNDKGDTIGASYYHTVSPLTNTTVGAEVTHNFSTNENTLTIGSQNKLDPLTTVKGRLNNFGKANALIQHEWRPKSLVIVSAEVDTKSIDKSANFGLALALKP